MTLPDGSGGRSQGDAEAEAVVWIALMHGPQWSRVAEIAHERWLLASEVNAAAWKVATDVWEEEIAPRRELPWPAQARHGAHLPDLCRFLGVLKRPLPAVRLLAFLALVMTTNPVGPGPEPAYGREFHRSTNIGQIDLVSLKDDSQVHLNTNTSITVAESSGHRDVILERGEVFTVVRHDERRPFHVAVGHVVIEDLGTRFDVSTDEGNTRVTVIEGKVRILERQDDGRVVDPLVASVGGPKREGTVLEVGDVAKVEEHGDGTATVYKGPRDMAEVTRRIQWLQGELVFTGQSLAEVVREINRYNRLQLVIDDPGIAELRIGGRFDVGDLIGFIKYLRIRDHIRAAMIIADGRSTQEIHLKGPSDEKGKR